MPTRSAVFAVLAVGMLLLSGCAGQEYRFEASPATASQSATADTEYELATQRTENVSREFDAGGATQKVTTVNRIAVYQHNISLGPLGEQPLALFALLSSPSISLFGEEYNPIADASNRALLRQAQQRNLLGEYGQLRDIQFESNRTVQLLGESTTMSKFAATLEVEGQSVPVYIHVAKTKHDDDFVVVAAAYPQQLEGVELPRVNTMLENVQHE